MYTPQFIPMTYQVVHERCAQPSPACMRVPWQTYMYVCNVTAAFNCKMCGVLKRYIFFIFAFGILHL